MQGEILVSPELSKIDAAKKFLSQYHQFFGLSESLDEIKMGNVNGGNFLKFQQIYKGIPVSSGRLLLTFYSDKPAIGLINNYTSQLEHIELPTPLDKEEAIRLFKEKLKESINKKININNVFEK